MSKRKWNEFGEITTNDDLISYLSGRQYCHGTYCHYTSLYVINEILGGKCLRLSSVEFFNDKKDKENFEPLKLYYSLCFSTGVNENLPLWYMYSGMYGKGGRLNFTKHQIILLLKNAQYSLYEIDEKKKPIKKISDLKKDKTILVEFKDVVYYLKRNGYYDLKYNTMTNHKMPASEFEKYIESHRTFAKSIIWYYEKESRIVAKLCGEAIELIDDNKKYCINMTISENVLKNLKINLAPEIEGEKLELELENYKNIKNHLLETSKVSLSAYNGTVEMRLCDKCENKQKQGE